MYLLWKNDFLKSDCRHFLHSEVFGYGESEFEVIFDLRTTLRHDTGYAIKFFRVYEHDLG